MDNEFKIAVLSCYGSFSYDSYTAVILYKEIDGLKKEVQFSSSFQFLIKSQSPEIKDEFSQDDIKEGMEMLKVKVDEAFCGIGEDEGRVLIEVPELATDFHVELLGPLKEGQEWLLAAEDALVIVSSISEGCGGGGEFSEVVKIVPSQGIDPEDEGEMLSVLNDVELDTDTFCTGIYNVNVFKNEDQNHKS